MSRFGALCPQKKICVYVWLVFYIKIDSFIFILFG